MPSLNPSPKPVPQSQIQLGKDLIPNCDPYILQMRIISKACPYRLQV